MTLLRRGVLALFLMIFATACYPDYDEPQRPELPAMRDESSTDTNAALPYAVVESEDAPNITMTISQLDMLAEQETASTGKLEMVLFFENSGDTDVTLNYDEDAFNLLDSNGLPVPPTEIEQALSPIEIPAGETVRVELEYPTVDTLSTYTFNLEGFPSVVVDVTTDPET